jgi:hypothetical protein
MMMNMIKIQLALFTLCTLCNAMSRPVFVRATLHAKSKKLNLIRVLVRLLPKTNGRPLIKVWHHTHKEDQSRMKKKEQSKMVVEITAKSMFSDDYQSDDGQGFSISNVRYNGDIYKIAFEEQLESETAKHGLQLARDLKESFVTRATRFDKLGLELALLKSEVLLEMAMRTVGPKITTQNESSAFVFLRAMEKYIQTQYPDGVPRQTQQVRQSKAAQIRQDTQSRQSKAATRGRRGKGARGRQNQSKTIEYDHVS